MAWRMSSRRALAVGLWWVYFHHFAVRTEHAIGERTGVHCIEDLHVLELFGAVALGGGVALYIAGTAFIWRRVAGEWALIRFAGATLCLLVIPLLAVLPAIVGLAVVAVIVGVLVGAEQFFGSRSKVAARPAA